MAGTTLEKGIDAVIKATEADRNRDYKEAVKLYGEGIKHFLYSINHEARGPAAKECIRNKCMQYLERAAKIQDCLKEANGDDGNELQTIMTGLILLNVQKVKWSDIAGLEATIAMLKEAVILPIRFPQLFTDKRLPTKGILLYGASGTGKSLLAKAVATEVNNSLSFYAVSAADLLKNFTADPEEGLKNLFEVAKGNKPTVLFVDEVDALCSTKSDEESQRARKIKLEFLNQLQGDSEDWEGVLVLAATNSPWALDGPTRRRFGKRIYVPLPDESARVELIKNFVGKTRNELTEENIHELARRTAGYSGADIKLFVQDALMQPVRKIQEATHFKKIQGPSSKDPNLIVDDLLIPCSPGDPGAIEMSWMEVEGDKLAEPPVKMNDMLKAFITLKPTLNNENVTKLEKFRRDFGEEG